MYILQSQAASGIDGIPSFVSVTGISICVFLDRAFWGNFGVSIFSENLLATLHSYMWQNALLPSGSTIGFPGPHGDLLGYLGPLFFYQGQHLK